jgi:hypothetical protein
VGLHRRGGPPHHPSWEGSRSLLAKPQSARLGPFPTSWPASAPGCQCPTARWRQPTVAGPPDRPRSSFECEDRGRSTQTFRKTVVQQGFWAHIDTSAGADACWPWLGRLSPWGYGLKKTGLPPNPVGTVQSPSAPAGMATHTFPSATRPLYSSPMSSKGVGMTPQRSS